MPMLQTFSLWPMHVYHCNISLDTSRSWFLLLYPSQVNLLIIPLKYSNLLFYLTYLVSSLRRWLLDNCKPVAYLSSYNQHKYCQLAEKYKLSVKLSFGIVGLALAVQPYYNNSSLMLLSIVFFILTSLEIWSNSLLKTLVCF